MSKVKGSSGFTLVELLLYLGLAAVMLLAISVFLAMMLASRVKNQTVAEVQQQGSQVINLITAAIRNAEAVNAPALGAASSVLSLDAFGSINDPTVFDLASGVLQIKEGSGAVVPLTSARLTASALNFQNLSRSGTPGNIRIQFTLSYVNPAGKNEYDYSKTFYASGSLR